MNGLPFSIAGKVAIFKAMVSGEPTPTVTWARNKGDMSDPEMYKTRYNERSREHALEVRFSTKLQRFGSEITSLSNRAVYYDGSLYSKNFFNLLCLKKKKKQIQNAQVDQADTYKCFATNPFGKAVCTAALSVFSGRQHIFIKTNDNIQ